MTRYEIGRLRELIAANADKDAWDMIDILDSVELDDVVGMTVIQGDITMDDVFTVIADGFADENAFDNVDYDINAYHAARDQLVVEGFKRDDLSLELIQTKMLMMGHPLRVHEVEGEWHDIYLSNIVAAIDKRANEVMEEEHCTRLHALCKLLDEGDFITYEGILQTAVFGKIICG